MGALRRRKRRRIQGRPARRWRWLGQFWQTWKHQLGTPSGWMRWWRIRTAASTSDWRGAGRPWCVLRVKNTDNKTYYYFTPEREIKIKWWNANDKHQSDNTPIKAVPRLVRHWNAVWELRRSVTTKFGKHAIYICHEVLLTVESSTSLCRWTHS
jgi:hypothetical protein